MDQRTDIVAMKGWATGSFAVSNGVACRFFRLTQRDRWDSPEKQLCLSHAEFFGSLFEQ
jgi:hypothetical protein